MAEPLYPAAWERTADVRVFRAPATDWDRLSTWSAEMRRRGFRLLRVSTERDQLVAIFGRTRDAHLKPAG